MFRRTDEQNRPTWQTEEAIDTLTVTADMESVHEVANWTPV